MTEIVRDFLPGRSREGANAARVPRCRSGAEEGKRETVHDFFRGYREGDTARFLARREMLREIRNMLLGESEHGWFRFIAFAGLIIR